ncbi:hypothetical protein F4818DRAFT_437989 [Hypoxylon cercidicola]|nr:hypothetical protein F4818DRAFT_437989 [Hypoxylon cercidicola]
MLESRGPARPWSSATIRTTVIGALLFVCYARRQLDIVDTFLAVAGAYAGFVDSYVGWREGNTRKAGFRLGQNMPPGTIVTQLMFLNTGDCQSNGRPTDTHAQGLG